MMMQQRSPAELDFAYCNVHRRRRQRHDLVDDPEQPGQLRCTLRRECRPFVPGGQFQRTDVQDDANWCSCRLHGRRRNINHMREVAPGEYECIAPHLCHSGPNPNQTARQNRPEGMAGAGGYFQPPRYDNENHPLMAARNQTAGMAMPAPPGGFGDVGHAAQSYGDKWEGPHIPTTGSHQPTWTGANNYFGPGEHDHGGAQIRIAPHHVVEAPQEVWCARHARRVAREFCEHVDDLFFVCRDSNHCLSGPLEQPNALPRDVHVLCCQHSTLRRVSFLQLHHEGQHYECRQHHQCRATDVHLLQQTNVGVAPSSFPVEGGPLEGGDPNNGWAGGWRQPSGGAHAPQGTPSAASFFA